MENEREIFMKKVFAFVMAACMAATMFVGCAPKEGEEEAARVIKIGTSGP